MRAYVRNIITVLAPLAGCHSGEVHSFELPTHGAMSAAAVSQSKFTSDPNASDLVRRLGIVDFPPGFPNRFPVFGRQYLDIGLTITLREGMPIERNVIDSIKEKSGISIPDHFRVGGWVMRGAIREDDNNIENGQNADPKLKSDEPGGVFNRVLGHFFDPKNNSGLATASIPIQPRATDWALAPGTKVNTPAPRENHFKITDAREAMWRALTLKTAAMGDGVFPQGWPTDASGRENLSKAYWATTFRALGDVIHLLQDMGQPQHTRNDWHSGLGCLPGGACALGHASFFENYLEARTLQRPYFFLKEGFTRPPILVPPIVAQVKTLEFSGYGSPPTFNSYGDYFATATGSGNSSGKGLANYSNRGFYSFGTNIGSLAGSTYPSPSPSGSGLNTEIVTYPDLKDIAGNTVSGYAKFKTGTVLDTATGLPDDNVKLATVGPWDQFLQQKSSSWSGPTLNHYNYDEQARLLVPRAVAYSAGLIDYFFRGQMFVGPPAEGVLALIDHGDPQSSCPACGFKRIKLNVANSTPPVTPPGGTPQAEAMTGGVVVAVAKFRRTNATPPCYNATLTQEYAAGATQLPDAYYDSCIGQNPEEIVVSDPITVTSLPSCDANVPGDCDLNARRMVFDFQQPIPMGSADIKVQVVYRGGLGSEVDAVVVETIEASEPSYYSFINATDYVKLGEHVYTRADIAANPGLIDLVKPDCKSGGALLDSCLQPKQITFALRVGTPPPAPAIAPAIPVDLPAGTFSRLAYLVPMGRTPPFSHSGSVCVPSNDTFVEGRTFQVDFPPVPGSPGTYQERKTVIKLPPEVRGVRSWEMVVCVLNGTNSDGNQPDDRNSVMQVLPDPGTPRIVQGFSFGT